jgi:hypothetical protein
MRLALLVCALLVSCRGAPAQMPANVPTADQLLAVVQSRQTHVRTLNANTKVEYWDNSAGERVNARIDMWIVRDGHLRLDVNTLAGLASSLAVADGGFQLLDVRADRYFTGAAAACNVERVIHIALPPSDIAAALLGDAPVLPHTAAEVSWNGRDKRWVLTLTLPDGGREGIELTEKERRIEHAERRGADGKRQWWLDHEDFATVGGVEMPRRSRFQQGDKADQDVSVKVRSQAINTAPPATTWTVLAPAGMVQEEMTCGR